MTDSFLRVDGDEHRLTSTRMLWQPGACEGRDGIVFQLVAHGPRTVAHLAGWAPGTTPEALSGQTVTLRSPGPDAAVDGRFFRDAVVRFGRVRDDRAVMSVDGALEPMESGATLLSAAEADLRGPVTPVRERTCCLGCGARLGAFASLVDTYVGGFRVRMRSVPWLCPTCAAAPPAVRSCPECGTAYAPEAVRTLGDDQTGEIGFTATCPSGHTYSGRLLPER